jgi:hypothetical protein
MKKSEKKYCPLLTIGSSILQVEYPQNCMQERCAWWDDTMKECSIKSIAKCLTTKWQE